jgi:hypothetical protein
MHSFVGSVTLLTLISCGKVDISVVDSRPNSAGNSDAVLPDPATDAASCGSGETAGNFSSDFAAGIPSRYQVFTEGAAFMEFVAGIVRIIPVRSTGKSYAYLASDQDNLRSHRVFVEVAKMVDTSKTVHALLSVNRFRVVGNYVTVGQVQGDMVARVWTSGVETLISKRPYVPANDRWWQIRERDDIVYYETSPDGKTWSLLGQSATPAWYSQANVEIAGGTDSDIAGSLGTANFDNLFDCYSP